MTPEEVDRMRDEILRKMPGWKRLKIAFELYDFARTLIRSRIHNAHPELSAGQIERLVTERFKR
jgi:hypothetical protein